MLPWASALREACYSKHSTALETPLPWSLLLWATWSQASTPTSWNPFLAGENKHLLLRTKTLTEKTFHIRDCSTKLKACFLRFYCRTTPDWSWGALFTCTFEICTEFQSFPDAALRVRGEGFFYILHADSARPIFALPEQTVNEHLQSKVWPLIIRNDQW